MRHASLILKSESELEQILEPTKNSLKKMSQLTFWEKHFENHKFHFDKNKFNWHTFRQTPFFTKKEFSKLGAKRRLLDVVKPLKKDPFRVVLMSTSGTTKGKPTLLAKSAVLDREGFGELLKESKRTLILLQPRTLTLRIICSFLPKTEHKDENNQVLFVNPFGFKAEMIKAVSQMSAELIMSPPAVVTYLTSTFPKIKQVFSTPNKIFLSGDFLSQKQASSITSLYPNLELKQDYMMGELDLVGRGCKFLRKRHGLNIYHPSDNRIIELINIDREGVGELVVTQLNPFEMGYIRYRTGDLAKAVKEQCPCGRQWTFYLAGRSGMDYFKCLGTLISRTEIERALKNFDNVIEEWRGEVREVGYKGSFIGELKLILKPYISMKRKKIDINKLENIISANLRLTPKKTLEMLVREKKFMPLKIELVDQFPQTAKKVLLRKILD